MRAEMAPLGSVGAVTSVEVSQLRSPGAASSSDWDWLIEMHFEAAEDATRAARADVCRDLVADLRLLGMRPSLALVDSTRALES